MRKLVLYGLVTVLGTFALVGCDLDEPTDIATADETPSDDFDDPDFREEEPEPNPEPKGEYVLASCTLNLGEPHRLLGSTEIHNTGDVPIRVEVNFRWLLGDGSKLEAKTKSGRVRPDQEKLVFFKQEVSLDTALVFQSHPKYFEGKNCRTRVKIRGG